MAAITPLHLLTLAGMPATATEPHLPRGNHLRVSHHPGLGLPVAPFILQRAMIDGHPDEVAQRRDVVLHDGAGRLLSLPLDLEAGQTVFAAIPQGPGASCVWASVIAEPVRPLPLPFPLPRPFPVPRPMPIPSPLRAAAAVPGRDRPVPPLAGAVPLAPARSPHVAAYGNAFGGDPALLVARAEAPYSLAAPGIAELRITGPGRITQILWLAAQDLDGLRWSSIDLLHLPREHGMRYLSIKGAEGRAHDAVVAQAPMRRPLHEMPAPAAPDAAPPFAASDELDRVTTLAAPLMADLEVLIDKPEPPLLAAETYDLTDDAGRPLAQGADEESTVSVGHLVRVMQGALDPGVAAYLGYKAVEAGDDRLGGLAIYRVIGFFRDPADLGADPALLTELSLSVIPNHDRTLRGETVDAIIRKEAGDLMRQRRLSLTGQLDAAPRHLALAAIAVVDRRAPPLAPRPPRLLPPEPGPWHPAPPPAALRRIDLPMAGVAPGALLALHRQQGPSAPASCLNPPADKDWHRPIALGLAGIEDDMPLADHDGREGVLSDPEAAEAAARYHLAQQDTFGRWSAPVSILAPAGIRPLPPRPILQGSYLPPDPALAAARGGMLHLHVPLPEDDALAPGSLRLAFLRLHFTHEPAEGGPSVAMPHLDLPVSAAIPVDQGSPPRRVIPASLEGPVLEQARMRRMIVTAQWHDTAQRSSALSDPLRLPMADPRPPAQLQIDDVLLYSARPDATGLAWIEHAWTLPPANPPLHAVYYSDEVRMLAWLRKVGRGAEADQIAARTDRAARAGMLRAIQSDFPDDLFERLPDVVEQTAPGHRRFRHAVSGSSRVLNAYRIAVEAPCSGARPDLSRLDTVFYAVPNSDPPPRPSVSVRMVPAGPQDHGAALVAEVTIAVEPGVTPPRRLRLHRTRGGPADPLSAPVVDEWALPVGAEGQQVQVFRDIGQARIVPDARLTPYAPYRWFALVQGAPESGSAVPGLWSEASDPAGLNAIPPDPPGPARLDRIEGQPVPGGLKDLALVVAHPLGLVPTPVGAWRFEVLRADPGGDWQAMAEGEARDAELRITDTVPGGVTALGTLFLVLLTDPTGRPAPPLEIEAR